MLHLLQIRLKSAILYSRTGVIILRRFIDSDKFKYIIIGVIVISITLSIIQYGISATLPIIPLGVIVIILLIYCMNKDKKANLLSYGQRINAEVTDYEVNRGASVNGYHAVRLVCRGSNNKTYYSSNYYVTSVISMVGKNAVVYIDKNDPQNYIVKVPGLPDENYGPDNVPLMVGKLFTFTGVCGSSMCAAASIGALINGDPLWWISLTIGGAFMLFGVPGLIIWRNYKNPLHKTDPELLITTGVRLRGTVTNCKEHKTLSTNGIHPCTLYAEATDGSGNKRRFKAKNVYLTNIEKAKGRSIDIYVSEKGKPYYIDIPEFKNALDL